jgi:hypothetical protein
MSNPNELSEEEQIELVKKQYWYIDYIDNPSEKVCLAAIKQNAWAIKYITNPNIEVCLEAIKQNGWSIQFVKKPTLEMVKISINDRCQLWKKSWEYVVINWSKEIQNYIKQCEELEDILC